jgi:hypothetical protein
VKVVEAESLRQWAAALLGSPVCSEVDAPTDALSGFSTHNVIQISEVAQ